jgi:DNA-binding beta-propeller fold protein YncE/predicted flap endonuclease-1-like 5' DNA nuclease
MKLRDSFNGDAPFEGERALRWRSIPANAWIVSATATITPVEASLSGESFAELLNFGGGGDNFGATKAVASSPTPPLSWVEVDFHSRRTLARATGHFNATTLQVDVGGGVYVEINRNGAFRTPSDPPIDDQFKFTGSSTPLPGLTVAKIKLTNASAAPPDLTALTIRSVPTNISLRLGALPPFWTHTGEMTQAETTPDFAAVLQAALGNTPVQNGFYDLLLVIHSDSIARLKIELEIDVLTQQDVLPPGLKEVVLPFDFSTLPQSSAAVLQVSVPPNTRVVPGASSARVKGTFAETRIAYGPTGAVIPTAAVEISPACSQAQIIALDDQNDTDISATAVDLFIEPTTASVRLRLDVRGDLDGKPADSSLLSSPVELTLDRQARTGVRWVSVPLPTEFLFTKTKEGKLQRYWLVLQSLQGDATWSVIKAAPTSALNMQCTRDGGLSWRDTLAIPGTLRDPNNSVAGPFTALLRLRRLPARFKVPIELQVGGGENEVRVKLNRFEPLGRVDFALDAELAQGINKYLDENASTAFSETEHLLNPDFEQWLRVGEVLTARPTLNLGVPVNAVAFAPDGSIAYVLDQDVTKQGFLLLIDVACNREITERRIPLALDDPKAFVISPDGTRAYVTDGNKLRLVNLTAEKTVGDLFDLLSPPSANDLTLSPDGQRLYVAKLSISTERKNLIWVIDTAKLEQQLANGLPQAGVQTVKVVPTIIQQQSPAALAVSPDGSLLYMVTDRGTDNGVLEILDATTFAAASPPVAVGHVATSLALTPDGTRAIVTNKQDGNISLIETATGTMNRIVVGKSPVDVAVSPEGTRAYVLNQESKSISIIDLSRQTVIADFSLEDEALVAVALALSPQGDQIYVANLVSRTLSSIQFGTRIPVEWQVTSGVVSPVCLPPPSPFHLVAVLGSDTLPTAISQVVPVAESCPFEFSFQGMALESENDDTPAVAEVLWLNPDCGLVQMNTVPIEVRGVKSAAPVRGVAAITDRNIPLIFHRARLTSPPGVSQAEVRFSVPKGGEATIDSVALIATSELTANADFKLQKDGLLADWMLTPKVTPGFAVLDTEDGIQLRNAGAATAELVQRVAAKSGELFTLEFQGQAVAAPSSQQIKQALELRWRKADGSSTGSPTVIEILPAGFDSSVASGTVPSDATQAELHLVVPPRTSLKVRRVSLRYSTPTNVPVTFIAEAPGELTVSDVRIAFEQVKPTPPQIPEGGLCIPTPPGRQPGETGGKSCFCHQCESEQAMIDAKAEMTAAARPAVVGRCAACREELVRFGSPAISQAQPFVALPLMARNAAVVALPSEAIIATGEIAFAAATTASGETSGVSANVITKIPLSTLVNARVKGIGIARSRQLAQIGINSLEELAATTPDRIAQIKGITMAMAAKLIDQAQEVIASEGSDNDSSQPQVT